jgi:uncharacterized protein YndB with AHSA1/START domain
MKDRIEKEIQIAAPVARVWQALTDSGEPVGGQITHPGYEHVRMEIVVKTIEPQTLFSYTWHPYAVDPKTDYSQETPTLVEIRLRANAGGTLLTVTESGFDKIPGARRDEAFRKNDGGWGQQMKNIQAYVTQTT